MIRFLWGGMCQTLPRIMTPVWRETGDSDGLWHPVSESVGWFNHWPPTLASLATTCWGPDPECHLDYFLKLHLVRSGESGFGQNCSFCEKRTPFGKKWWQEIYKNGENVENPLETSILVVLVDRWGVVNRQKPLCTNLISSGEEWWEQLLRLDAFWPKRHSGPDCEFSRQSKSRARPGFPNV